jgi:surface polysaccharide O-acyltransferase-like enzyme
MPETKRLINFELLRIIAMLMVVTMHYLLKAEMLPSLTDAVNGYHIFGWALESFCIVAVNIFVLISGYFMVKSQFKFRRFFRLIAQVLFYTLLIPLVLSVFGLPLIAEQEGVYGFIEYILPLSTGHYWFISAYILLYLISPFLNAAFEKIPQNQMIKLLLLIVIVFSGIKSIIPFSLNMDFFGYDFGWFICLYLTGGYIRIYGFKGLENKYRGLILYLVSVSLIFFLKGASYLIHARTGVLEYFYHVPFHYNFILVYFAAIGLFYVFKEWAEKAPVPEIKAGRAAAVIRWMAPFCLGVYLVHMHVDVRDNWYSWTGFLFGGLLELGFFGRIIHLVLTVLFIFLAGIFIDFIRHRIFRGIEENIIDEYNLKRNRNKP